MSKVEGVVKVWKVVDKFGVRVKGTGVKAKDLYTRESDAKGVATQFNNIVIMRDGEGVQLKGAPFRHVHAGVANLD